MTDRPHRRNLVAQRIERALARRSGEADPQKLAAAVQDALGYVPVDAHQAIAERAGCAREVVERAVAGAEALRTEPHGRHRVTICTGRTCARRGGAKLLRSARRRLGVGVFETSADGAIHLEPFRCFGQCAMAPNIRIDGGVRGAMTLDRFELLVDVLRRPPRD